MKSYRVQSDWNVGEFDSGDPLVYQAFLVDSDGTILDRGPIRATSDEAGQDGRWMLGAAMDYTTPAEAPPAELDGIDLAEARYRLNKQLAEEYAEEWSVRDHSETLAATIARYQSYAEAGQSTEVTYHIFSDGSDDWEDDFTKAKARFYELVTEEGRAARLFVEVYTDRENDVMLGEDCILSYGPYPS